MDRLILCLGLRPKQFPLLYAINHRRKDANPRNDKSNRHGASEQLQSPALEYGPHDFGCTDLEQRGGSEPNRVQQTREVIVGIDVEAF